jgi:pectate lyase
VHPGITEANMVATYHRNSRYHLMALIELQAGESLGAPIGRELVQWASDDLKAFATHAYDEPTNSFLSLIADGTRLKGEQSRSHYYRKDALGPQQAGAKTVWAYATAYRLTKDPAHWALLRKVCSKLTFGDIGSPDGGGRRMRFTCGWTDYALIYGFLELWHATGDESFLAMASRIGDNILSHRTQATCLPKEFVYVRTGDESVLALLHVAAARQGKSRMIPRPARDQQYFHCAHDEATSRQVGPDRWDQRTWDHLAIYSQRRAPETPAE